MDGRLETMIPMKPQDLPSLTFRLLTLSLLTIALLSSTARGQTTFAQFTQDSSIEAFTFSNANATFQGMTTGDLTFLAAGAPVGPQAANITLTSSAMTQASTAGPFLFQPIDGATNTLSFTRISDGANLLTLTFTGTFSGFNSDTIAALSGDSNAGDTVVYSSDFLTFSNADSRAFNLNATPDPDYSQGMNGFLNNFATDLNGSFAATVPEPSTWFAGVLTAAAIGAFALRRRKPLA